MCTQVFTADELNTAMISPLDTVLALQPYALPRGGTSGYSNFRHEYSIYGGNKDLIPVNNTFKYCESLPGEGSKVVRSKDSRVNAALQEMTVAVVKFVEAIRRVHITKLCAEFCVDSDNVPWFMCTTTCLTVKRSKITGQARRHADKDAACVVCMRESHQQTYVQWGRGGSCSNKSFLRIEKNSIVVPSPIRSARSGGIPG